MANLTSKQAKFIASYQIDPDATKAAINAGYSANSAAVEGCRLLKNPKIMNELEQWRAKRSSEITKSDLVDKVMSDYESVDVVEPNRPRFIELAGKLLGHLGANNDQRTQTINNLTQINVNVDSTQPELWEATRKLLGNE